MVMGYIDELEDIKKRKALGLIALLFLWSWGIYLVRHREQIIQQWKERHRMLVDENCGLLKRYTLLVWNVPRVCWSAFPSRSFPTLGLG